MLIHKCRRGFNLIEMLIAAGLMSAVIMGAGTIFSRIFSVQSETKSETWLEIRRTEILEALKSDSSFAAMVAINDPPMPCLLSAQGCPGIDPTVVRPFRIRLTGPNAMNTLDGTTPAIGFDADGNICDTFDTANPGLCNYGVDLTWRLICGGSPSCRNPEALLQVRFHSRTRNNADPRADNKNMLKYNISVVRGQRLNSIWETCNALGGTYDPVTITCQPNINCPIANQYVTGFDALGSPICRTLNLSCPLNQTITGFNADGSPICQGCP